VPLLQPTQARLQTYTGKPLTVLGAINIDVQYQKQSATLPLVVVRGSGPMLLGRDGLQKQGIIWTRSVLRVGGTHSFGSEEGRIHLLLGDYKVTINKVAKVDSYPLPRIEDLFATLGKGKTYTKLDLCCLYRWYPRDRIIEEQTPEDSRRSTSTLGSRWIEAETREVPFMLSSEDYLGYVIPSEGLSPNPEKIRAIVDAPAPRDVQQVRSFLSLNYYSQFLPSLSTTLAPL